MSTCGWRRRGRKGVLFGGDNNIGRLGGGWSEMKHDVRGADGLKI